MDQSGQSEEASGCISDLGRLILGIAFAGVVYVFVITGIPSGIALFNGNFSFPFVIHVARWNVTHFPPTIETGTVCDEKSVHTPEAQALKERTLAIGRELEILYGHNLLVATDVVVVHWLPIHTGVNDPFGKKTNEHGGLAVHSGWKSCVIIPLSNENPEPAIRHEWAHVAADRLMGGPAWHGPEWQAIATQFGADNVHLYVD